jgi:glycosyltransferase involved in cell wall biosynthesis
MKRVLIVAYHFPPLGGIGVQRTLKFAKYLPQFGFEPIVLTVRNRSIGVLDPTLLEEVPPEAKVIDTFSAEHRFLRASRLIGVSSKWFLLPDAYIGWLPFAVRRGEAIIRKEDVDIIFATAPVFTSLLVGHLLKRKTGKPLVLDFRDSWTQNVFETYPTRLHLKLEEKMESLVLRSADHVVTTTAEMARALMEKYPFIRSRCETIPNGFDSSDFGGLERSASSDRFTITYTGRLYGVRTARPFLTALSSLVGRNRILRDKMRVVVAGPKHESTLRLVQELGLEDIVEIKGFLSHRESLQLMVNTDVLLLVMSQEEVVGNGIGTLMIPGKTLEYLAAKRPILALAPEGAVSELVRRTGSGVVVSPEEVGAIEEAILDLFGRWPTGTLSVAR